MPDSYRPPSYRALVSEGSSQRSSVAHKLPSDPPETSSMPTLALIEDADELHSSRPPTREGEAAPVYDLDGLFRAHSAYVAGVAIRLLGRDAEVEDLVQDVFLEAHRGIHRLRNPEAVRAWLVKVTVRTARRRLQLRRARRFLHLDDEPDYGHLIAPGTGQEDATEIKWVYATLDRMPSDERVCWTLRFIESHSLEEIVELTGLSMSTVKRRINLAKERLRKARGG